MPESKKIHILMILGWYYPDSVGGTENYVKLLCNDLKSLNHEVTILAPSNNETENKYEYEGITVYRYPISLTPSLKEIRVQEQPKYFEFYEKLVKEINPDIAHFHSYTRTCSVYHAQVVKELGIPVITTVHVPDFICARGTLMKWGESVCSGEMVAEECTACVSQMHGIPKVLSSSLNHIPDFISERSLTMENKIGTALSMKKIISKRIANSKDMFELSDSIVSVSEWLNKVLLINKVNEGKIFLSRHGLSQKNNINREKNIDQNSDLLTIGYIGRFKPVKGVHILIEAIKRLSIDAQAELQIYGRADTDEERSYLDKLKLLSINEKRIKFAGEVTQENRLQVFSAIDILAIPSIWLETGPYVLFEAFCAGVPVIGSDLGGISENIKDGVNGKLVKAGSIDDWSESIENLSKNKNILKAYASHIPLVRDSMDVACDMIGLYESLLKIDDKSEATAS